MSNWSALQLVFVELYGHDTTAILNKKDMIELLDVLNDM